MALIKLSDCETCDATNVNVTIKHGNIWMCEACIAKDNELAARNEAAKAIITESQAIDASIQVKTDLHLVGTVAIVQLRAAVDNDSTIADDQKDYVFAKLCLERTQHMQKVVFEQRKELNAKENEMRAWQTQTQLAAGKLRKEYREHFRMLDITYQPAPVKTVKPSSKPETTGKGRTIKTKELVEVAKKYGVPPSALKMTMSVRKEMTLENAAKFLAQQMGIAVQ